MTETTNLTPFNELMASASPGNGTSRQHALVYAVGQIGYDFGAHPIRDSFRLIGLPNPDKHETMVGYLRQIYEPMVADLEKMFNANCEPALRIRIRTEKEWPMSPLLELARDSKPEVPPPSPEDTGPPPEAERVEELRMRGQELQELEQELQERERKLDELEQELQERTQRLNEMQEDLRELERRSVDKTLEEPQRQDAQEQLQGADRELKRRQQELEELRQAIEQLRRENGDRRQYFVERQEQLRTLQEELEGRERNAPRMAMAFEPPWDWELVRGSPHLKEKKKLFHYIEARRHILSQWMYNQPAAGRLIWTLNHDGKPVYAISPQGPFAAATYSLLIQYLLDQTHYNVSWFSIPGRIAGEVRLLNNQVVPVIEPEIQGMFSWKVLEGDQPEMQLRVPQNARQHVMDRYLYEVRNPGRSPQERALNFSATTAFMIEDILDVVDKGMELSSIKVEPAPACRSGSDCWDTFLAFFNPSDTDEPQCFFKFTVDVSDVVPVQIGKSREWRGGPPSKADPV